MNTVTFHITKEKADELKREQIQEFSQCGRRFQVIAVVDAGHLAQSHSHSWRLVAEPIKNKRRKKNEANV